jgi:hypothetical protein
MPFVLLSSFAFQPLMCDHRLRKANTTAARLSFVRHLSFAALVPSWVVFLVLVGSCRPRDEELSRKTSRDTFKGYKGRLNGEVTRQEP